MKYLTGLALEGAPTADSLHLATELGFTALIPGGAPRFAGDRAEMASGISIGELETMIRVRLDIFANDHETARRSASAFFAPNSIEPAQDPRARGETAGTVKARLADREASEKLVPELTEWLIGLNRQGVAGVILEAPVEDAAPFYRQLIEAVRGDGASLTFIASIPGLGRNDALALAEAGFDAVVSSLAWWDARQPWLIDEREELRAAAALIADFDCGEISGAPAAARLIRAAGGLSDGFIIGEKAIRRSGEIAAACREAIAVRREAARFDGAALMLSGAASPATCVAISQGHDLRHAEEALILLINPDADAESPLDDLMANGFSGFPMQRLTRVSGDEAPLAPLMPGEARYLLASRLPSIKVKQSPDIKQATAAATAPRLVVEALAPAVSGGDFPVRRLVGETVVVTADIFTDGHEQLAAELLWRAEDERRWRTVPMSAEGNDVWTASFKPERLGRHEFTLEAWLDRFGGFRRDFATKLDAGVARNIDVMEGRALLDASLDRAKGASRTRIKAALGALDRTDGSAEAGADILLARGLADAMRVADDRPFRLRAPRQLLDAGRIETRFSSWYELFPRSQSLKPGRHGSFSDVIERLPAIREMGFDTLYFPPIHPIGRKNRKGPNNATEAGPDDPGSPYAIGAEEGGHDAIHPELGTLDDFRALVSAASDHGLEIALDFAIQCAPDHPWLKQHPGWFAWRPDGSMKYAENPPKKYQDIVNVEFYGVEAIPDLWIALRDIVLFWVDQGIRTFRVDNPHTKPLPFWEWMIGSVRARHPDAIFLAEAFTRPKVMSRLAKIGFSQSYTYFTWRNTKAELTEYITELTTSPAREYFGPHFFVNTPDINPIPLQTSGRAGFQARAALAATLSGLFGVYSGFELCEAAPLPGREEYLDSEKYEVRQRDWRASENIIADITLLNRMRRTYPALQTHLNTVFYEAWNDRIIYYAKPSPVGRDMILVAVNLDPHNEQSTDFEIPLWEWGLSDDDALTVRDLATEESFVWTGKVQRTTLSPDRPYRLWRVAPREAINVG